MNSNKIVRVFAVTVALLGMATVLTAQAKEHHLRYKVVDLGTLGGSFSNAIGVNNRGDVVGIASVTGDISFHAFLWTDGQMTDLGILGRPERLPLSQAVSINDAGEIIGISQMFVPDPFGENFCGEFLICLPVVWENKAITALPTLGGTNGLANDVNESGVVVGTAENDEPDTTCVSPAIFHFKPVLWENGLAFSLPSIGDDPDGFVVAVNDRGEAVGVTLNCSFTSPGHSVLWRQRKAFDMNASGGDLTAEPSDINNKTQVTGTAFNASGLMLAMLWQNGVTRVIGALPGHVESHGNAINNKGQIEGQSCAPSGFPDCSVFLWQNGVMRDLNDLVSDRSLKLVDSGKINDRGQVVGLAITQGGEFHGFLASPANDDSVDTESSAALPTNQPRPRPDLPELVRKMLDRQMFHKSPLLRRVVPLKSSQ